VELSSWSAGHSSDRWGVLRSRSESRPVSEPLSLFDFGRPARRPGSDWAGLPSIALPSLRAWRVRGLIGAGQGHGVDLPALFPTPLCITPNYCLCLAVSSLFHRAQDRSLQPYRAHPHGLSRWHRTLGKGWGLP
jgi:hypothetical protein